jgi:hypothetical protein
MASYACSRSFTPTSLTPAYVNALSLWRSAQLSAAPWRRGRAGLHHVPGHDDAPVASRPGLGVRRSAARGCRAQTPGDTKPSGGRQAPGGFFVPAHASDGRADGAAAIGLLRRELHLAQAIHMGLAASPYFFCEALEANRGATAAEMVAAVAANEALAASEPVDVTIGGLTGKQVDVQIDPGWTGSCPGDPPTLDLRDMRVRGTLLDSPDRGVLAIFTSSLHAAGHDAFLADAMPILERFQFDSGQ